MQERGKKRERLKWGKFKLEGKTKKQIQIPEDLKERLQKVLMRKDRLVIVLLAGVLLLVIALPVSDKEETAPGGRTESEDAVSRGEPEGWDTKDYADYLERKLAEALSHVKGVGRTKVMVTLASGSERIIEKDTNSGSESIQETDSQGGSRNTINSSSSQETVYSGGEGGNGEPYVTKELTPIVEGVVVVAEGGDDPVAVQNITEAVQALFEIDTHKIKVMKSN